MQSQTSGVLGALASAAFWGRHSKCIMYHVISGFYAVVRISFRLSGSLIINLLLVSVLRSKTIVT